MISFIDICIVLTLVAAGYFGTRNGTIRQITISVGLLAGLFALLFTYRRLGFLGSGSGPRMIILILLLLAVGLLFYSLSLRLGQLLTKTWHLKKEHLKWWDRTGGSTVAVIAMTTVVWLMSAIFRSTSVPFISGQLNSSLALAAINRIVDAPAIAKTAGRLLNPFGSPAVFIGTEPKFNLGSVAIGQEFRALDAAIRRTKPRTLKVNAWGCGSSIVGSGFLIGPSLVMTNAHVIAGVDRMSVQIPGNISQTARAVWFDPNQDIAVLRTESILNNTPLVVSSRVFKPGELGAVIGYPGGGRLKSDDAIVLEYLSAQGYDVYGHKKVTRKLYATRSDIIAGNSGGPLINSRGEVAGMVIGHSSSQSKTGYAIAATTLRDALSRAQNQLATVNTGHCGKN